MSVGTETKKKKVKKKLTETGYRKFENAKNCNMKMRIRKLGSSG